MDDDDGDFTCTSVGMWIKSSASVGRMSFSFCSNYNATGIRLQPHRSPDGHGKTFFLSSESNIWNTTVWLSLLFIASTNDCSLLRDSLSKSKNLSSNQCFKNT